MKTFSVSLLGAVIFSAVFSVFGMKDDDNNLVSSRLYENNVKKFWLELSNKRNNDESEDKRVKYHEEHDNYFMMHITWPTKKNIVYVLGECGVKDYERMKNSFGENNLILIDARDKVSLQGLTRFLGKDTLSCSTQQYIMEGDLDTIREKLKDECKELSHFVVQHIKSKSCSNLKFNLGGEKDAWLDVFLHDEYVNKDKKELIYLLNFDAVKAFLVSYEYELYKQYIPVATSVLYCADDIITLFSAYEKIKNNITVGYQEFKNEKIIKIDDVCVRKKMILEALKYVPEQAKKLNIVGLKNDEKFLISLGMKRIRTLNQYTV